MKKKEKKPILIGFIIFSFLIFLDDSNKVIYGIKSPSRNNEPSMFL